jgi:hypothetical protein
VIPSDEYMSEFVPAPVTTHIVPFHATPEEKPVMRAYPEVDAVHVIPSDE